MISKFCCKLKIPDGQYIDAIHHLILAPLHLLGLTTLVWWIHLAFQAKNIKVKQGETRSREVKTEVLNYKTFCLWEPFICCIWYAWKSMNRTCSEFLMARKFTNKTKPNMKITFTGKMFYFKVPRDLPTDQQKPNLRQRDVSRSSFRCHLKMMSHSEWVIKCESSSVIHDWLISES